MNAPARPRLTSIDAVRGLIMIVMALDHARDFLGLKGLMATDLAKTDAAYFLTRWVTHFCAPGFLLLAGTSAFLAGKPTPESSRFLLSRGLWLVVVELTLVHFAWTFSFSRPLLMVIWALGCSMIVLAGLVWLPRAWILGLSIAAICLHNLLDGATVGPLFDAAGTPVGSASDWLLSVLHQKNAPVMYPLVPWVAVMALGYGLGPVFQQPQQRRRRTLVALGLGALVGFVVLRALNVYGDASAWSTQASGGFTLLSFLNTTKYPPSLLYLLMTLGPLFLALAAAESLGGGLVERVLVVFGRAPFFYYVLHLYLLHAAAVGLGVLQGFPSAAFLGPFWKFPKQFGLGLGGVYLAWGAAIVALVFPTRWFAGLKARRRDWWLSYL